MPDVHYIALEKDFSNVDGILGKLSDFDFLQGFANRAYDHLIASGRYSYKALTNAIEGAIDEFYPLITASVDAQHRREIAQLWQARHDPSSPHEIALAELPTEDPQLPDYLRQKSELLNELLRHQVSIEDVQAQPLPAQEEPAESTSKIGPIRKIWHLLPPSVRYRIGPRLAASSIRNFLVPDMAYLVNRIWERR